MSNGSGFNTYPDEDVTKYKKGPRRFAMWLVNGEWISSSKTNEEVDAIRLRQQFAEKESVNGSYEAMKRKSCRTDKITYLQALQAQKDIESGKYTYNRIGVMLKTNGGFIKRAIEFVNETGPSAFLFYGDE